LASSGLWVFGWLSISGYMEGKASSSESRAMPSSTHCAVASIFLPQNKYYGRLTATAEPETPAGPTGPTAPTGPVQAPGLERGPRQQV